MATAPLYGDPKVAPAAVPGNTLAAPQGNLLAGIAQSSMAAGGQLADEAARVKEEFENVAVMGATSELTGHKEDAWQALKARRGNVAFEFSNSMMSEFDKKASDIGAKLTTRRSRELYAQEAQRLKLGLDGQRKEYIGGELVSHAKAVGEGMRFNQTRAVVSAADSMTFDEKGQLNTGRLDQELANLKAATEFQYKAQPGTDEGLIAAEVTQDRQAALNEAWELVRTRGDPATNDQFLQKYGGQMRGVDWAHAREQSRITSETAAVTDFKAAVLGNVMDDNYRPPPKGFKGFPLMAGEYEAPIDWKRPMVLNEDGTLSTERSITVQASEIDPADTSGKWVNIPTAVRGPPGKNSRIVSQDEAIDAVRSGKEKILGVYTTVERAEAAAEARHQWWASAEEWNPAHVTASDRQRGAEILLDREPDEKKRNAAKSEVDRFFSAQRAGEQQKEAEDYETAAKLQRDQGWDVARLELERPDLIENMDSRGYDALVSADDQRAKGVRVQADYAVFIDAIKDLGNERTAAGDKAATKNWMPELVKGSITQPQYDDIVKYQKAYLEGDKETLQELITPRDVAKKYSDMLYRGKVNPITKDAPVADEADREEIEFMNNLQEAGQAKMRENKVTKLTSSEWEEVASELANTKVVVDFDWEWRGGNDYISLVDVAGEYPASIRIEAAQLLASKNEVLTEASIRIKAAQIVEANRAAAAELAAQGVSP